LEHDTRAKGKIGNTEKERREKNLWLALRYLHALDTSWIFVFSASKAENDGKV